MGVTCDDGFVGVTCCVRFMGVTSGDGIIGVTCDDGFMGKTSCDGFMGVTCSDCFLGRNIVTMFSWAEKFYNGITDRNMRHWLHVLQHAVLVSCVVTCSIISRCCNIASACVRHKKFGCSSSHLMLLCC